MAKVELTTPHIVCIKYLQEKDDTDYGYCLWGNFIFNLDTWELIITSDRGTFAHRWPKEKHEDFLQFISRCEKGYILQKLCGRPNEFSYEKTKKNLYDLYHNEEETTSYLNRIFEEIESDGYAINTPEIFLIKFEENDTERRFYDTFELPMFEYPYDAKCITEIFSKFIVPKVNQILQERKEQNHA